jgi:hypothetical protein
MPYRKAGSSWFEVISQLRTNSCAMASIAMVVKMHTGVHISDDYWEKQSRGSNANSYDLYGTGPTEAVSLLTIWKVSNAVRAVTTANGPAIQQCLLQASKNNPVVLGIRWNVGGGHMIVSPGANGTNWIALDPAEDGTASEQPLNNLPQYNHPSGRVVTTV